MAVDPKQAALAQAIATHGSAGIQQAQDAANTGAAGKQAALSGAAGRAGLINAPTDFLKQAASQVAQPYNNAASSAANTSAAIGAYTNSLKGANDNYMSQLQGAVPLMQAQVDAASKSQDLGQMMQLYNLQRQQASDARAEALNAPKLQAAQDAAAMETNQKAVMNKILTHPDKALSSSAINIISSNTSGTLPEALAYLNSDQGKKDIQKAGVKDDTALRQTLTEYYSDPSTYSALQSAQAAQQAATPAPAAPSAGGVSTPFTHDFTTGAGIAGPQLLNAVKSLVPGAQATKSKGLMNYFFGK